MGYRLGVMEDEGLWVIEGLLVIGYGLVKGYWLGVMGYGGLRIEVTNHQQWLLWGFRNGCTFALRKWRDNSLLESPFLF